GSVAEFAGTMPARAGSVNDRAAAYTTPAGSRRCVPWPLGRTLRNRQIISVSKRGCEYGLSAASAQYRSRFKVRPRFCRHLALFFGEKTASQTVTRTYFFAVD